jgi:hypothetical protein
MYSERSLRDSGHARFYRKLIEAAQQAFSIGTEQPDAFAELPATLALWKSARVTLKIWSWRKRGPRGKRKTWQLRREAS